MNAQLVVENQTLQHENRQLTILLKDYETTLEQIMTRFRTHAVRATFLFVVIFESSLSYQLIEIWFFLNSTPPSNMNSILPNITSLPCCH